MTNIKKQQYNYQKGNANKRGIQFLLTFDEWCEIWDSSGYYPLRGPRKGQYCMSRRGDLGPYIVGNVFIQLSSQNTIDAQKGKKDIPQTAASNLKRSLSMKGKNTGPKPKVQCPYCPLKGAMCNMVRYHFSNCKMKRDSEESL